jgi:predicted DCC family thiol-disulfide oxidoreductase YuxK
MIGEGLMDESTGPIVFYDGDCALCSRMVQRIVKWDRQGVFRFAPLKGTTFERLCAGRLPDPPDSIILRDKDGVFIRTEAIRRILLGVDRRILATALRLIPRPLRDWAYDQIARRRIGWFGHADNCLADLSTVRGRMLP